MKKPGQFLEEGCSKPRLLRQTACLAGVGAECVPEAVGAGRRGEREEHGGK